MGKLKTKRGAQYVLLIVAVLAIAYGVFRNNSHRPVSDGMHKNNSSQSNPGQQSDQSGPSSPAASESRNGLIFPIADFETRITKKPFGIYITPSNSPVQPERFTGYHTGDDVEYQDISDDVPVFAIADCQVTLSKIVSGYGGVFIVSFEFDGEKHSAIYGHIRPSTLPRVNTNFKKGSQLAFLGTGYSAETDNERRHLHFGVLADNSLDLRGYVQNKSELSGWIDPKIIF